jgi:hypothetical protein
MGAGQGGSPSYRSGVDTAPDNVSSPDLRARWFTAETSKIGLEITAGSACMANGAAGCSPTLGKAVALCSVRSAQICTDGHVLML